MFAGGTPDRDNPSYWEGGTIPWLNSGEVGQGIIRTPSAYITDEALRKSSAKWIPRGALVMALAGQGKTKGTVAQLDFEATCNQSMAAIVPSGLVHPRFLLWWLECHYETIRNLAGGDLRDGLNLDIVGDIPCPLPPAQTQRAIADFLDAETAPIDALIELKTTLAERLTERTVAAINDRVLGQSALDGTSIHSGMDCVGLIPSHFRVMRNKTFLREVVDLSDAGDEELLTVSHLTGVTPRADKDVTMFMAETNEGYKRVQPGDLVINTMWAWMGALGVARQEGIVSPAYGVYRVRPEVADPLYLEAVFRSPPYVAEMTRMSRGVWSSRLRLYPDTFLSMRTPLPPLQDQVRRAEEIDHIRSASAHAVDLLNESIRLLQERRRALVTSGVTGGYAVSGAVT